MSAIEMIDFVGMARRVLRLREREAEAEQALRTVRAELAEAEAQLVACMRQENMSSCTLEGKTIVVQTFTSYRLPPLNSDEYTLALAWIEKHGGADLIKRQVSHQSASAFIRDLAAEGCEIPEFIRRFSEDRISVR